MKTGNIIALVLCGIGGLWMVWKYSRERLVWGDLKEQYGKRIAFWVILGCVFVAVLVRLLAW